jgi:hypothetical protein
MVVTQVLEQGVPQEAVRATQEVAEGGLLTLELGLVDGGRKVPLEGDSQGLGRGG